MTAECVEYSRKENLIKVMHLDNDGFWNESTFKPTNQGIFNYTLKMYKKQGCTLIDLDQFEEDMSE